MSRITRSSRSRLLVSETLTVDKERLPSVRQALPAALLLLALAAIIALVWSNSPFGDSYTALRDTTVGPAALHLNLTLGTWAGDGLLAIFFFVVALIFVYRSFYGMRISGEKLGE